MQTAATPTSSNSGTTAPTAHATHLSTASISSSQPTGSDPTTQASNGFNTCHAANRPPASAPPLAPPVAPPTTHGSLIHIPGLPSWNEKSTPKATNTLTVATAATQRTEPKPTSGASTVGASSATSIKTTGTKSPPSTQGANKGKAVGFSGNARPVQVVPNQSTTPPSAVDIDMKDPEAAADGPKAESCASCVSGAMGGVVSPSSNAAVPLSQQQAAPLAIGGASSAQCEVQDETMDDPPAPSTDQPEIKDETMDDLPDLYADQPGFNDVTMDDPPAEIKDETMGEPPTSTTDQTSGFGETTDMRNTSAHSIQPQTNAGTKCNTETCGANAIGESQSQGTQAAGAPGFLIAPELQALLPSVASSSSSLAGILELHDSVIGSKVIRGRRYPQYRRKRRWTTKRNDLRNVAGQASDWGILFEVNSPSDIWVKMGWGQLHPVAFKKHDRFLLDVPVQADSSGDNDKSTISTNDILDTSNVDLKNNKGSFASSRDLSQTDITACQAVDSSGSLASQKQDDFSPPYHATRKQMHVEQQDSLSAAAGPSRTSGTDNFVPPAKDTIIVPPHENIQTPEEIIHTGVSVSATKISVPVQQQQQEEEAQTVEEDCRAELSTIAVEAVPVQQQAQSQTTEDTDINMSSQCANPEESNDQSGQETMPATQPNAFINIMGNTTEGLELPQFHARPGKWQWFLRLLLEHIFTAVFVNNVIALRSIHDFGLQVLKRFHDKILIPFGTIMWSWGLIPAGKAVRDYGPKIIDHAKSTVSGLAGTLCKTVAAGWNLFRSARTSDAAPPPPPSPATPNVSQTPAGPTQPGWSPSVASAQQPSFGARLQCFNCRFSVPVYEQPSSTARYQSPAPRTTWQSLITPKQVDRFNDYRVDHSGYRYLHTFHGDDARKARALYDFRNPSLRPNCKMGPTPWLS
ncbi:hypothetical protein DPSP01_009596 [Paraphaeosphaeria sporulosa]